MNELILKIGKIELKVGQRVKFRNDEQGVVRYKLPCFLEYDFVVKHATDGEMCDYTQDGCFYADKRISEYDVVEILEGA